MLQHPGKTLFEATVTSSPLSYVVRAHVLLLMCCRGILLSLLSLLQATSHSESRSSHRCRRHNHTHLNRSGPNIIHTKTSQVSDILRTFLLCFSISPSTRITTWRWIILRRKASTELRRSRLPRNRVCSSETRNATNIKPKWVEDSVTTLVNTTVKRSKMKAELQCFTVRAFLGSNSSCALFQEEIKAEENAVIRKIVEGKMDIRY